MMIDLKLGDIAAAVDGRLLNCDADLRINQVIIDSRKLQPLLADVDVDAEENKVLFVAIKGEQVDGNDYAESAFRNGAVAVLVSKQLETDAKVPQIIVQDTCKALKKLASYYRQKFSMPFVAVTGSTGKTSTKEMIASVLSQKFHTHKTRMNFNNEIGLPLTILELEKAHEVSVLEMGMDKFGEIECLSEIARPSIGVITNIGTAHIENLGSRQNIMKAKLELTTWFDKDSLLIINADDDCLTNVTSDTYRIKRMSLNGAGDYNATEIRIDGAAGVDFKCNYRGEVYGFRLNVPGRHNVYNAMAAIAVADALDMDIEQIKRGIEEFRPVGQRMNIMETGNNITIINDCYNANPDSMKAAMDVLQVYGPRRRIAVLGDMYELGDYAEEAHALVGAYACGRCDMLVAVGEDARFMYESAKNRLEGCWLKSKDEAATYLKSIIREHDVVLIKASRGMKMEEITNRLVEMIDAAADDDAYGKRE